MRRLRVISAWIAALAILLAGPVASLGECLRCPPDCPMHAPRVAPDDGGDHAQHGAAAAHAAHETSGHAAHEGAAPTDAKPCHETPAPEPEEGPCLSGVCGHMDVSLARLLPDGVLVGPGALAPVLIPDPPAGRGHTLRTLLPSAPPTEPPRTVSA